MNQEHAPHSFSFGYLQSEYLAALSDLFYAPDAESALSQTLRRIVTLSGSGAAFIGLSDTYDFENTGSGFVCATTGDQFQNVKTYEEMIAMVSALGWADPLLIFEGTLPADKFQPERKLIGYPLFDQLGGHRGVLLTVVFTKKSMQLIEDLCALFVFLVMYRVQEFELIRRVQDPENGAVAKILSSRGLLFPEVSSISHQIIHDINGRLAIGAMQVQVFRDFELSTSARARGLDRLSEAISSVGALITSEEQVIDLLLGGKGTRPIEESISLALRTFGIGLDRHLPIVVDFGAEGGRSRIFPGSVAFWLIHNIFRVCALVDHLAPPRSESDSSPLTSSHSPSESERKISLQVIPGGFLLRFPSSDGLTGLGDGFLGQDHVSRFGVHLPAMFSLLRETAVLCGTSIEFATKNDAVEIKTLF